MMVLEASDSLPWDDFVRVPGGRTTLALLVSTLLALVSSPARANPIYHPRAAEPGVLPPSWDTLSCTNCHVSIGGGNECGSFPCFNPFGYQYWTHDRGWAAIAALDADDDGRSNEQELTLDGTLPGFPEAATHTGCDMTTCAIDGAQDCADGLRCESAHAFDRATTHYVFWFSCGAGLAGSLAPDAADWSAACVDIDECATSPCGSGACSDVPLASWAWPGYGCACGPGQGFDGSTCVTAGECTDGSAGCVAGALCADPSPVLGDAVCGCAPGEIGDARVGGTGCTDADECASAPCDHGICHALALDAWSAPGFECACHAGYVWTGGACELVDECALAGHGIFFGLDGGLPETFTPGPSLVSLLEDQITGSRAVNLILPATLPEIPRIRAVLEQIRTIAGSAQRG